MFDKDMKMTIINWTGGFFCIAIVAICITVTHIYMPPKSPLSFCASSSEVRNTPFCMELVRRKE